MTALEKIIREIKRASQKGRTKLVAIDGLGGSGKTTLSKSLLNLEPEFKLLKLDHFPCLPKEHPLHQEGAQERVSFERFKNEALIPLVEGRPAIYQNTFWWPTTMTPKEHRIEPGGTVLVEGCYTFHSELRQYYDYSIWVDCPETEAIRRAILRDGKQGTNIWKKVHAPNERNYASKQRPMDYVDLVVLNGINGYTLKNP